MAVTTSGMPAGAAGWLTTADPRQVVLVIPCSAAKALGGQPRAAAAGSQGEPWPEALLSARAGVLGRSDADMSRVMPAWRRYQGGFYRHARPALGDAAAAGNVVIISGGYGLADACEAIGWYDKVLRLADWPPGLLESALTARARKASVDLVVGFAATSSSYAYLLRRTRWRHAGLQACLVTITGVTGGAMAEVPRRLGLAFAAFWNQQHDGYPPGTEVQPLS
jgi:hypothetical protein